MLFFRKKKDEQLEQKKQEILLKVKPILSDLLDVPEEKVIPAARLIEDLGADSLDAIEITMGLEEAFDIEIFDEDIEKMETIEDVIIYLARHINVSANNCL